MGNNDFLPPRPAPKNLILKRRKFLIVMAAFALLGATLLAQSQAATNPPAGSQSDTANKPPATCDSSASRPAASVNGYKLADCEDFNGTTMPDNWVAFDGNTEGTIGAGFMPGQCAFGNGTASLTQGTDGATCGIRSNFSQKYGLWEVRMRTFTTGDSGSAPYPQLLLRPTDSRIYMNQLQYFGANIDQTTFEANFTCVGNPAISCFRIKRDSDITQWHTYGLEWTADGFKGYLDGQQVYATASTGIAPDSGMSQVIQLGNMSQTTPVKTGKLEIDWAHVYSK
jgi:hypothetical protein